MTARLPRFPRRPAPWVAALLLAVACLPGLAAAASPAPAEVLSLVAGKKKATAARARKKRAARAPEPPPPAATPAPAPAAPDDGGNEPREPTGAAARPLRGQVVYVTATRAYLDRGAEDGVVQGMKLALGRKGSSSSCDVEQVAPHSAVCAGTDVRLGDRFTVQPPPSEPQPAPRPRPAPEQELARRNAALREAPPLLVRDEARAASDALGRRMRASVELAHASWLAFSSADGSFHEERLDVVVRGAPVAGPFRLYADLTALRRTAPATTRFRPGEETQLYVREAELSARDPGSSWTLSAGRLWPWYAPGSPSMDGAQAGFRTEGGGLEVGGFAGGIPEPEDLTPRLDAWTAGGYWSLRRADDGGAIPFLRQEGRIAAISIPGLGQRLEGEGLVHASFFGKLDASADVRARLDEPALSATRLELGGKPLERLRLAGGFRWLDVDAAALEGAGTVASRRGDVSATHLTTDWLTLGAAAGHAAELATGAERSWVGPEVGLPELFGSTGGLTIGYQEELGFLEGRAAWVQSVLLPARTVRVISRLSYFEDASGAEELPEVFREVGLFAGADARLASWLSIQAALLFRAGLPTLGGELEGISLPTGLHGTLSLRGEL